MLDCDVWLFMVMSWSTFWSFGFSADTPIVGCFGSVWLNRASRDLLASGETPVSCFGLMLTRVDLVTQPVTYLVFGYIVTWRIIIIVVVVVVMF